MFGINLPKNGVSDLKKIKFILGRESIVCTFVPNFIVLA